MDEDQLIELSSAFLSIVLSHHYQKDEINRIVARTNVDFGMVRDTMHKYSKRAEEKFFKRSCMAFFFIQFAWSRHGKAYIESKLTANAEKAAQSGKDNGAEDPCFPMTSTVTFAPSPAQRPTDSLVMQSQVSFDE